ncbi:MAG: hypothetical protein K2M48_02130, partial [Clostridiales bacterium]|nr:hypothetical protein [Clostridiales bacterium]
MGVSYRKAVVSDTDSISDMMLRYVDCPWTAAQVVDEINNPDAPFYVATAGEQVVGFLSGVYAADECEISDVAVELPFRRHKV